LSQPILWTQKGSGFVHDLTPITALGGAAPQVDTVAGMTLTENPALALACVAARLGREKPCGTALQKLLGATAPGPGKAHLADPFSAVWMGPDQWMIGADFATYETLDVTLKKVIKDSGSVTEQTDAWVCFDLTGDAIQPVMELVCAVDMRRMQSGDATRTNIHHLGCFVVCGDPTGFVRIIGPRASAGSLHHALLAAMKSAL